MCLGLQSVAWLRDPAVLLRRYQGAGRVHLCYPRRVPLLGERGLSPGSDPRVLYCLEPQRSFAPNQSEVSNRLETI